MLVTSVSPAFSKVKGVKTLPYLLYFKQLQNLFTLGIYPQSRAMLKTSHITFKLTVMPILGIFIFHVNISFQEF